MFEFSDKAYPTTPFRLGIAMNTRTSAAGFLILLTACTSTKSPETAIGPDAVVGVSTPDVVTAAPVDADTTETAPRSDPDHQPRPVYTVAAMIGQVNGRALYADSVLEPLDDQLRNLGQRLRPESFHREIQTILYANLRQIIFDALILGEAERSLTDEEQMRVTHIVAERRKELLRQFLGSEQRAERELLAQFGLTLDETLKESRQQVIISNYLRQQLLPKINVTRKDIERYYTDHFDGFDEQVTRKLRLIKVSTEEDALAIEQRLAAGEPFSDVARDPSNLFKPQHGGLFSEASTGDPFNHPQLNEAMVILTAGQHSSRIEIDTFVWWLQVESLERIPQQSLRDTQLKIESILTEQRYRSLTADYRDRLVREGSYSPGIDQMAQVLIDVTMARYAAPPQ